MASCEQCWKDSGGDADRYRELIEDRKGHPCTPEQQAGGYQAGPCPKCGRMTLHVYVRACMVSECGYREKCGGEEA